MSLRSTAVRAQTENSAAQNSCEAHRTSVSTEKQVTVADYARTLVTRCLVPAAWLVSLLFRCKHRNVTLPYNNRQTCLDCGAARLYLFHTDFEHADAGIFTGSWRKHTDTVRQGNARRLLRKAYRLNTAVNRHPFHEGMTLEAFDKAVQG